MLSKFTYVFSLFAIATLISLNAFGQRTFKATGTSFRSWQLPSSWVQTAGPILGGNQYPEINDTAVVENFARIFTVVNQDVSKIIIGSNSQINVGNRDNAPVLTVTGNLIFSGIGDRRLLLAQGKVLIEENVIFNNNQVLFYMPELSAFPGLPREIELKGAVTDASGVPTSIGQIHELPLNSNSYISTTRLTGIGDQNLTFTTGTIKNIHNDIIVDKPSGILTLTNAFNNQTLKGNLSVLNGFVDLDNINLTTINAFVDQLDFAAGSTIKIKDNPNGLPTQTDAGGTGNVLNMQPGSNSIIEVSEFNSFNIGSGTPTFNLNLGNLTLEGLGTVRLNVNINPILNNAYSVNDLVVNEGTLEIDASVTDISGITGDIIIRDGATLRIYGNPLMPLASQFILEEGSTVEYAGVVAQNILGGVDYWNLAFDGTGVKTTSANLSFQGEMSFGFDVTTLEIDHNITIQSGMLNTGYISEVPTGYTFDYTGGGQFICERFFISSPIDNNNASENYRDFSLPLKNAQALLSQFDDDNPAAYTYNGSKFTNLLELPIFGVAGSKYPGPGTNVSDFNSFTGAFGKPSNYNNSIVQTNGGGRITTNAVRFGYGTEDGITIMAKGEVNIGDVPFNAQKSTFGKEFNLFGNPYPSAIDFEAVVAGNPNFNTSGAGIIPTFYVIAPDLVGANNVAFYNAVTNAGTISRTIPAFQGFFLEVAGANNTNYDFTIKEDMKSLQNLATYKSNTIEDSPELISIIARENNVVKDQIHAYFFDGATVNYDEFFDVKKLEPKIGALSGAQIDFYDGKKKMNLLANAISSEIEINLPFVIDNPSGKTITIELENLNHLLDVFNCVYVENLRTGETFPIDGNYLSIAMGTLSTETFALKSKSAPELFEISKTDATCFGLEDGILRVDMSKLPENSPITVFKNNTPFDSFTSTADVYKRNVGAGDYEFKISGISSSCSYVYRENIKEEPEVKSQFILADSLYVGKDLVFKSTAVNATLNEWFTSKGETLYGDSIVMNYETAGKHWLKLTAIGKYSHCKDEELKFFIVDSAQTSVGVKELETSALFSEVIISTQTEQLTIANLPNNTKVELINTIGQILEISDENKGIVTFAPLNNASYIIRLTNNGEVQSYHIGL